MSRHIEDRTQKLTDLIVSHVDNPYLSSSRCPWHANRSCFLVLSNFNASRFHCLYAKDSDTWRSYGACKFSCDLPEHFHDTVVLKNELGSKFVLPFSTHFRERRGYTIGMFRLDRDLYGPTIVKDRDRFKHLFFAYVVFLCALCRRLGGVVPSLNACTFLYEPPDRPVLVDVGAKNSKNRERIGDTDYMNEKLWLRFLRRKTTRDVVRFARANHPQFFVKKAKRGSACILATAASPSEAAFDDETHLLVCRNGKTPLVEVLKTFAHLVEDEDVRTRILPEWIEAASRHSEDQHSSCRRRRDQTS